MSVLLVRSVLVLGVVLTFVALSSVQAVHVDPPLRIMPLGDSITHGVCCNEPTAAVSGYRGPLAHLLVEAGIDFDFVGSLKDGAPDLLDQDHEGHDGWTTHQLREVVVDRLATYRPDMVLLSAGTNDLVEAGNPEMEASRAAESLGLLIDAIGESAPDMVILVAPIPPIDFKEAYWPSVVDDYNAASCAEVARRIAAGRRVVWVPIALSIDHLSDRVHPTAEGYRLMASSWAKAISGVVTLPPAADLPPKQAVSGSVAYPPASNACY